MADQLARRVKEVEGLGENELAAFPACAIYVNEALVLALSLK